MSNELQLQTGPYRTTYIGTEITRASTKKEWTTYGEILRRVDEAKQWAIGDWLVDGKHHYGDGLYREAAGVLGYAEQSLKQFKVLADAFSIKFRYLNLSWNHHQEVASLRKLETDVKGKMKLSDEPDMEKMQEFLQRAEKEELSVASLREIVKTYKRQQDENIRLANTPKKYSVIYADPPWKYSDGLADGYGAADHHYPLMSIAELCKMPIRNIAADNAVLFLWVTAPILGECWPVIDAWGFEYKAQFIWDKEKHNYGHYNSVRHEHLLICTRGSYLPENKELIDSVVVCKRSDEHSKKPDRFRKIIETLYPSSKKIELFSRTKVKGWDFHGDNTNSF